jgi:hypothetical protein
LQRKRSSSRRFLSEGVFPRHCYVTRGKEMVCTKQLSSVMNRNVKYHDSGVDICGSLICSASESVRLDGLDGLTYTAV